MKKIAEKMLTSLWRIFTETIDWEIMDDPRFHLSYYGEETVLCDRKGMYGFTLKETRKHWLLGDLYYYVYHSPVFDDEGIFYNEEEIICTYSPKDLINRLWEVATVRKIISS